MHRLPREERRRKKWLEVIGANLRGTGKDVYICSLHFSEDCFNKTMEVVRLRDEAVPSKSKIPETGQNNDASLILGGHDYLRSSNFLPLKTYTSPDSGGPGNATAPATVPAEKSVIINAAPDIVTNPLRVGTPPPRVNAAVIHDATVPVDPLKIDTLPPPPRPTDAKYSASVFETASIAMAQTLKIQRLERRCVNLQKKVKRMQQTIRRRNKKMAEYKNIIKELWENVANDENLTVTRAELENLNQEACQAPSRKPVGPELAKRQATLASKIETIITRPNITNGLTLELGNGKKRRMCRRKLSEIGNFSHFRLNNVVFQTMSAGRRGIFGKRVPGSADSQAQGHRTDNRPTSPTRWQWKAGITVGCTKHDRRMNNVKYGGAAVIRETRQSFHTRKF